MPTAKNGFYILNLHPKKYIFQEKKLFKGQFTRKIPYVLKHQFKYKLKKVLKYSCLNT